MSKANAFDAIVIGSGSVGVPTAMALAGENMKVLVLDSRASTGQGSNKAAIGGVRATHSDGSKIRTCLRTLEIFSTWKEKYGDDIGWQKGGYLFPAYTESDEAMMRDLLKVQKKFGLKIDWISPAELRKTVPGINPENLRGGTFAPEDGSASTLLSTTAFHRRARELGVQFRYNEAVTSIETEKGKVKAVVSARERYFAPWVINAAGVNAKEVSALVKVDVPVSPDTHEAGITEPVAKMFAPMVVDIREEGASKNYYFYQNSEGQIVFCLTPHPQNWGTDRSSTSVFLPTVARRMIKLLPSLAGIKVRRTWRGLYPMTPDGFPIIDCCDEPKGFVQAVGMCGQGFMMGPGVGELVARMVTGKLTAQDREVLKGYSSKRSFTGMEKFT